MRAGKEGGEGRGRLGVGVGELLGGWGGGCWDYGWKNTGWCPGKGWEDAAVPERRDIKGCLRKTLNPYKTLNCEHYF